MRFSYNVYLIDDGPEPNPWDVVNDHYLMIRDGALIFYKVRPDEPSVVYPLARFWILRNE